MTDPSKATLEDVPYIVETIRALRRLTEESGTITKNTQSALLRVIPPVVLSEVARQLARPTLAMVLSGDSKVSVQ